MAQQFHPCKMKEPGLLGTRSDHSPGRVFRACLREGAAPGFPTPAGDPGRFSPHYDMIWLLGEIYFCRVGMRNCKVIECVGIWRQTKFQNFSRSLKRSGQN